MTSYELEPFDVRSADDDAFRARWELDEALRAERMPDDPPVPFETFLGRNRNVPEYYQLWGLTARAPGEAGFAGSVFLGYDTSGQNAHLASVDIDIRPQYRRQGLGRRLLHLAAEAAQKRERRLLIGYSASPVPAGAAFAEAAGAQAGLVERHSQLVIAELDHELLRDWQACAAERAIGFELLFWDHVYPEELIVPFADLCEVMNSAPRGELDVEDQKTTPEKLRAWHTSLSAGGQRHWTVVVREQATGNLAGFSELFLNPARPTIIGQGATGVRPAYRNLGLGRWLKADNLERVLQERPEARVIRTDNAETNAAMLAINVALGFRHYMDVTVWQLETAQALAFSAER